MRKEKKDDHHLVLPSAVTEGSQIITWGHLQLETGRRGKREGARNEGPKRRNGASAQGNLGDVVHNRKRAGGDLCAEEPPRWGKGKGYAPVFNSPETMSAESSELTVT